MVLVDYIGILFYMWQYFWPHAVHVVLVIVLCFVCLRLVSCVLNICCQFLWIVHHIVKKLSRNSYCINKTLHFSIFFSFLHFIVVFCLSPSCVLCTQYMLPVSVDCPFCFTLLSHSIYYHLMFGFQMSSPFFLFLAWRQSWLEVGITGHNFGRGHPRTIPPKFGCNWPSGFWRED
jgi:hypothetical protein